jgi:predicted glycoside hydrolase/deacetylase ChbG (UPF0249 family)
VKRLIVNADDFGLAPGVNSAIAELARAGALSSTTLMAAGPFFSAAAELALAEPALGVGCHIVLTDGVPVLPASEVRSLLDPGNPASGCFRPQLTAFIRDLWLGRIRKQEIEAEACAQIRRLQSCGIQVTHLDSHKHTHIFSRVLDPLLRAAKACGVRAMRNPFEPGWSLRATPGAGRLRRLEVHALRIPGFAFARTARENGIHTTDGSIGMLATGSLDQAALSSLLQAMPDGVWELVCHPGYRDAVLDRTATRLRDSREMERSALLATVPPRRGDDPNFRLVSFRDLVLESVRD